MSWHAHYLSASGLPLSPPTPLPPAYPPWLQQVCDDTVMIMTTSSWAWLVTHRYTHHTGYTASSKSYQSSWTSHPCIHSSVAGLTNAVAPYFVQSQLYTFSLLMGCSVAVAAFTMVHIHGKHICPSWRIHQYFTLLCDWMLGQQNLWWNSKMSDLPIEWWCKNMNTYWMFATW